ncbi:hypothetical protein CDL15_Pgr010262 [Punica granatum]|uniref:Uncharacterized protein n=1 Tax=Punica granatum TaxID=22663 RepID=A0A218WVP6_PUNGR|nr:hypothetical protein CDL15_Pgr010262 [Punica granatum]
MGHPLRIHLDYFSAQELSHSGTSRLLFCSGVIPFGYAPTTFLHRGHPLRVRPDYFSAQGSSPSGTSRLLFCTGVIPFGEQRGNGVRVSLAAANTKRVSWNRSLSTRGRTSIAVVAFVDRQPEHAAMPPNHIKHEQCFRFLSEAIQTLQMTSERQNKHTPLRKSIAEDWSDEITASEVRTALP